MSSKLSPLDHVRYLGPIPHLKNKMALVRAANDEFTDDGDWTVLAQFDNWDAERDGVDLAHGWHEFARSDFSGWQPFRLADPGDMGAPQFNV